MENLVVDLKRIYKGKKVFVTGHTGFKGSWLIMWLRELGAEIKGYALAPQNSTDLYPAIGGNELCESVIADIRDKDRLSTEILSFNPDFIFHLAAQPLVRSSYELPIDTFAVNIMGTANVLEAIRFLANSCVAVIITTDKVYYNQESDYHYKEEDRLGGFDPYSASKACAELIVDSYRNSFFTPSDYEKHRKSISTARAGNVIGGGDWAKDRIIPDIIRALLLNQPAVIRSPASIRPWQHVLEPLHGYLLLAAHQFIDPVMFADSYNFGPNKYDVLSVGELVINAINVWGSGTYHNRIDKQQVHEASLLHLDITKAVNRLGWKPVFNTIEAITYTIEWYRKNILESADARSLLLSDINKLVQHD